MDEQQTINDLVEDLKNIEQPAPQQPAQQQPQGSDEFKPTEKEMLEFYRHKEQLRQQTMLNDPLIGVKELLGETNLSFDEQNYILKTIQEIKDNTDIKDPAALTSLAKNYALPNFVKSKEMERERNDIAESQNFKWLDRTYGQYGRDALKEFNKFSAEQWGDATPEFMRHDLFKTRFPAFLERRFAGGAAESRRNQEHQARIEMVQKMRETKPN